ncbi:MAG: VPLPA-CTERM sorting domain-containing protein [Gemmobacter sp.]
MRNFLCAIAFPVAALVVSPVHAVTVAWVDWQSSTPNSATGVITVGSETINVSFSNSVNNFFVQTGGGTDYWTPRTDSSPYTSTGPVGNVNPPTGTDIIALAAGGTRTLTFSRMIQGLYFSYVSLNANAGTFSTPMVKLSETGKNIDGAGVDSAGFWGSGTLTLDPSGMSFTSSGEAHGTLYAAAALDSFVFTTGTENWHGFTVGIAGLPTAPPPPPPPSAIPLPAGGLLLIGALGGLAALRRRRK